MNPHQDRTPINRSRRNQKLAAALANGAVLAVLYGAFLSAHSASAQVPVTLTVEPALAGPAIASDFVGLSYETALVLPGSNGKYFFTPENKDLVQMFRTLGVKSLRVGGNTAERETVPIPGKADIDHVFGFAKAAGVKVIYTLRLKGADPQADADLAKYMIGHYRSELACFALGNEPEKMAKDYPAYREAFRRFLAVITAPTNAPDAWFCGPSTTHKNAAWAGHFAQDFGRDPRIALVTQHEYPARSGTNIASVAAGCEKLLSPNLLKVYEGFYDEFVPAALSNGIPYRLEEANSFSNGGAAGVSDALAAALWGLDYLYWWAAHGAAGINFHTGGYVPGTHPRAPMKYAVFWNAEDGFAARPLAYALKAFDLAAVGRMVPATFTAQNTKSLNLRAYAVLARDKTLHVTLINKEHGPDRQDVDVILDPGDTYARGAVMFLAAASNGVEAKSGVTLGRAAINNHGDWSGTWTLLEGSSGSGQFKLKLPAATAAIVKLTTD